MMRELKHRCPECNSTNVLQILYGYPTEEDLKKAAEGKVILEGCIDTLNPPQWKCVNCGNKWLHDVEENIFNRKPRKGV